VLLLLARAWDQLGNSDAARRERQRGAELPPDDEAAWVARAFSRAAGDPAAALEDVNRAMQWNAYYPISSSPRRPKRWNSLRLKRPSSSYWAGARGRPERRENAPARPKASLLPWTSQHILCQYVSSSSGLLLHA
jgi:hypothetical protein